MHRYSRRNQNIFGKMLFDDGSGPELHFDYSRWTAHGFLSNVSYKIKYPTNVTLGIFFTNRPINSRLKSKS